MSLALGEPIQVSETNRFDGLVGHLPESPGVDGASEGGMGR
jgi:hypothetical protein